MANEPPSDTAGDPSYTDLFGVSITDAALEPPFNSPEADLMADPVHLWDVRASVPVDHGAGRRRPSYDNLRFAVVARTMERVMAIARERYPDIRFHSIEKRNYMGKAAVMIDPEASDVE